MFKSFFGRFVFMLAIIAFMLSTINFFLQEEANTSTETNSPQSVTPEIAAPEMVSPEPENRLVQPENIYNPMDRLVLVNKENPLSPIDFYPTDLVSVPDSGLLRSEAALALQEMFAASKQAGLDLAVVSSFRSYKYQIDLYQNYVYENGENEANTFSAKPGFSEHQTGLALDLAAAKSCELNNCPKNISAWAWLKENSQNFGFILRYPEDYTHITGYVYEPWHFRYIGVTAAQIMKNNTIATLEQLLLD